MKNCKNKAASHNAAKIDCQAQEQLDSEREIPIGPRAAEKAMLKSVDINRYLEAAHEWEPRRRLRRLVIAGRELGLKKDDFVWLLQAGNDASLDSSRDYASITDSDRDRFLLATLGFSDLPRGFRRAILAVKFQTRYNLEKDEDNSKTKYAFDLIFPEPVIDASGYPIRLARAGWLDRVPRPDIIDHTYAILDYERPLIYRGGCWFAQDTESCDCLTSRRLAAVNMNGLVGNRRQWLAMLEATELFDEMRAEPKIFVLNSEWREAPGYYESLRILMELLDPTGESTYVVQLSELSNVPYLTLADEFRRGLQLSQLFARVRPLHRIGHVHLRA